MPEQTPSSTEVQTTVSFFYEQRHLSRPTMPTTAMTFVYGGVLGVLAAALLEPIFVLEALMAYLVEILMQFRR